MNKMINLYGERSGYCHTFIRLTYLETLKVSFGNFHPFCQRFLANYPSGLARKPLGSGYCHKFNLLDFTLSVASSGWFSFLVD